METPAYLQQLLVIFGVALAVVLVLGRLRLPAIAGYLVAGALVGPSGFRLVGDSRQIQTLAEIGVALLLFTIGLEFSLARLRRLWKALVLGGSMQVGLTILAVFTIARAVGLTAASGLFYGFLVALSSTAIVLRSLVERGEVDAPHGRLIVGALVFQDLCVVPMMLLVPRLAGAEGSLADILLTLGKAAAVVVGVVFLGRLIVGRALELVARTRKRDLFLIAVLLICSGIAWLTSLLGLSLALGAFLAGIALAESELAHQALSDVLPFRETLASLFFVTVGMLFDAQLVLAQPALIFGLAFGVLMLKTFVGALAGLVMRFPPRVAILSGLGLAQIGEFSFVLAAVGRRGGLLAEQDGRVFVAVGLLTMVASPLLGTVAPHLAARGAARLRRLERLIVRTPREERHEPAEHRISDHVVVVGYGVAGRLLAEALRETGVPYLVLELNLDAVRRARANGDPAFFGDATNPEVLERIGVRAARELVIVINDSDAARRAVAAAHRHAPEVPILVRTRYLVDVPDLEALGAGDVVAEEFEAGIEILARVLRRVGATRDVILAQMEKARASGSGRERPVSMPRRLLGEVRALSELEIETLIVREEDWIQGRTLAEFHLVVAGAATVVALGRGDKTTTNPRPFETVQAGDTLYLVADAAQAAHATQLLTRGPEGEPEGEEDG